MVQALPIPPFPGGLLQPQDYPTCCRKKYKINSSIKQWPLVVTSWNVRTLHDTGLGARCRTALIACELARYSIDIAALSGTSLPKEASLVEIGTGYTFSGVVYPQLSVTFIALDLQLGLCFCRATNDPPLQ